MCECTSVMILILSHLDRNLHATNCGDCCRVQRHLCPEVPWVNRQCTLDIRTLLLAYNQYVLRGVFQDGLLTCNLENLINATRELGIETSYDQANGFALGGYFCPHNQDPADQTRSSAKEAYYDTAKTRSNLEIITGHRVTRILTSDKSGSLAATGVEVGTPGIPNRGSYSPVSLQFASANNATRQTVSAKREVILAAGSLHSPQLLQVSGIGDPKIHTKIGVATVVDLPAVGQNLQDHVLLTVVNSRTFSLVTFHAKYENHHLRS